MQSANVAYSGVFNSIDCCLVTFFYFILFFIMVFRLVEWAAFSCHRPREYQNRKKKRKTIIRATTIWSEQWALEHTLLISCCYSNHNEGGSCEWPERWSPYDQSPAAWIERFPCVCVLWPGLLCLASRFALRPPDRTHYVCMHARFIKIVLLPAC